MLSRLTRVSMISLALLVFVSPVTAGMLLPDPANGNPATAKTVWNNLDWTVSLNPNPLVYLSPEAGSPWLMPALTTDKQFYNNATNVWNFSYAAQFNGTFTMKSYFAFTKGHFGGADFTIDYKPGAGDPTGNQVRWIQVIDTNKPEGLSADFGVDGTGDNGIPEGTKAYLDNGVFRNVGSGKREDPWYGHLSVPAGKDITKSKFADSTHFHDHAQLSLQVYGGVEWGFQHSATEREHNSDGLPEPSTIVLLVTGGGIIGLVRRRKSTGSVAI
jgi:hypothetical protein